MSDLPPNWEWTTLGEIADTRLGKMLDRGKSTNHHMVPYLRNVNVQWGRFDLSNILTMEIPPSRRDDFAVLPGDLLICEGGEVGRCAVWNRGGEYISYQKALHRVRPTHGINAQYLRYFLERIKETEALMRFTTGSTIKHLPQEQLRNVRIPLAPLAEQLRIVAALEEHLSRLDAASANVRNALTNLDKYMASARQSISTQYSSGSQTLGDILEGIEAGKSFSTESRPANDDEWGIIKVSAMTWGEFQSAENKAVPANKPIDGRHEIRPGDVLVSRANTEKYVGAPVLVRRTRSKLLLSDKSLRLVPKASVNREWLIEVLSSPGVRDQISQRATGMKDSMRNISQKALKEIVIPVANSKQQERVAEQFSAIREQCGRLRTELQTAAAREDLLRKSLLAEAFSGRLVEQDPADEPASVLLERIKAERATRPKAKRARRKKTSEPVQESLL